MATVFKHDHFCPTCNELWTCVCWACVGDLVDRECNQCRLLQVAPNRCHERDNPSAQRRLRRLKLAHVLKRYLRFLRWNSFRRNG